MTSPKVRKKKIKAADKCDYRNIQLMPGRTDLWQFEVQSKDGQWHTITNLGGSNKEARLDIITKTALHYGKKSFNG